MTMRMQRVTHWHGGEPQQIWLDLDAVETMVPADVPEEMRGQVGSAVVFTLRSGKVLSVAGSVDGWLPRLNG